MNPKLKLILIAVGVGLSAALASLSADATWDGATLRGALAAGLAAAVQYFTPLSEIGVGGKL